MASASSHNIGDDEQFDHSCESGHRSQQGSGILRSSRRRGQCDRRVSARSLYGCIFWREIAGGPNFVRRSSLLPSHATSHCVTAAARSSRKLDSCLRESLSLRLHAFGTSRVHTSRQLQGTSTVALATDPGGSNVFFSIGQGSRGVHKADFHSGSMLSEFLDSRRGVWSLHVHPVHRHFVAMLSHDKVLRIWNHETNKIWRSVQVNIQSQYHNLHVTWHPEKLIAVIFAARLVGLVNFDMTLADDTIAPFFQVVHRFYGTITTGTIHPSGDYVLAAVQPHKSNGTQLWRVFVKDTERPPEKLLPHILSWSNTSMAISPDGKFLVTVVNSNREFIDVRKPMTAQHAGGRSSCHAPQEQGNESTAAKSDVPLIYSLTNNNSLATTAMRNAATTKTSSRLRNAIKVMAQGSKSVRARKNRRRVNDSENSIQSQGQKSRKTRHHVNYSENSTESQEQTAESIENRQAMDDDQHSTESRFPLPFQAVKIAGSSQPGEDTQKVEEYSSTRGCNQMQSLLNAGQDNLTSGRQTSFTSKFVIAAGFKSMSRLPGSNHALSASHSHVQKRQRQSDINNAQLKENEKRFCYDPNSQGEAAKQLFVQESPQHGVPALEGIVNHVDMAVSAIQARNGSVADQMAQAHVDRIIEMQDPAKQLELLRSLPPAVANLKVASIKYSALIWNFRLENIWMRCKEEAEVYKRQGLTYPDFSAASLHARIPSSFSKTFHDPNWKPVHRWMLPGSMRNRPFDALPDTTNEDACTELPLMTNCLMDVGKADNHEKSDPLHGFVEQNSIRVKALKGVAEFDEQQPTKIVRGVILRPVVDLRPNPYFSDNALLRIQKWVDIRGGSWSISPSSTQGSLQGYVTILKKQDRCKGRATSYTLRSTAFSEGNQNLRDSLCPSTLYFNSISQEFSRKLHHLRNSLESATSRRQRWSCASPNINDPRFAVSITELFGRCKDRAKPEIALFSLTDSNFMHKLATFPTRVSTRMGRYDPAISSISISSSGSIAVAYSTTTPINGGREPFGIDIFRLHVHNGEWAIIPTQLLVCSEVHINAVKFLQHDPSSLAFTSGRTCRLGRIVFESSLVGQAARKLILGESTGTDGNSATNRQISG